MVKPVARALLLVTLRESTDVPALRSSRSLSAAERAKHDLDTSLLLVGALEEYFDAAMRHDAYADAVGKTGERLMGGRENPLLQKRGAGGGANMRPLVEAFRKSLERGKKNIRMRGSIA